jgi:hypothetical protein
MKSGLDAMPLFLLDDLLKTDGIVKKSIIFDNFQGNLNYVLPKLESERLTS